MTELKLNEGAILHIDEEIDKLFPPLHPNIHSALKNDILARGIQEQLTVDGEGAVICGCNRFKISQELELPVEQIPFKVIHFNSRFEMMEYALKDNNLRRQLTLFQKCEMIKEILPNAEKIVKYNKRQGNRQGGLASVGRRRKQKSDSI